MRPRIVFFTALFGSFVSGAMAQTASPPPSLSDVLSAVTLDFNGDALQDRALLVETRTEDGSKRADLHLFLAEGVERTVLKPALVKTDVSFFGPMWGQMPSLSVSGTGALLIRSENSAIGRTKWEQTLTVLYRNSAFVVAGITYQARDGIDPKGGGACDLNLLTGKGFRNGKPISGVIKIQLLKDWSDDAMPESCRF